MDVSTRTTKDLVDFSGQWSNSDRKLVTEAVEAVESTKLAHVRRPHCAPWIASRHQTNGADLYVTSRFGFAAVVRARSAEELAEKIRHLDPDPSALTNANPHPPRLGSTRSGERVQCRM